MTIQVYVKARSKRALNEQIVLLKSADCLEYSLAGAQLHDLVNLPAGTVVKLYDRVIDGNPYAKAYGMWDGTKVK